MNYSATTAVVDRPDAEPALLAADAPTPVGPGMTSAPILLEYWRILVKWRWVILGIVALSGLAGIIITLMMTPQYTAATRIEISRDEKRITNIEGVESTSGNRFDQEFYQTQYTLLAARSVAERVARVLKLSEDDQFFAAHGVDLAEAGLERRPGTVRSAKQREQLQRMATGLLQGHVNIAPIPRSSLVDVRYTSAAPAISAKIANAWAEQFIADSIDRRFASSADARQFLERRLNEMRTRLQQSERELVDYATANKIVALAKTEDQNGRTSVARTLVAENLETLNRALAQATADRAAAEARAEAGSGLAETNVGAVASLRQRRAEAQSEYARLMVQYEPGYPAAQALREQIKSLDTAIGREEARARSGVSSDYQGAVQREAALRARVDDLTKQLNSQQQASIHYNNLQREVDTNRQLYEGLLQRYKEIGVASVGANNIAVVDAARAPGGPSSPNLPLNVMAALLIGLALAGVVVFALEQIDEGLRTPADVNKLGLSLLGSVPQLQDGEAIEAIFDPKSQASEAYLTVRSNLAFSTDHGVPRSFMVTSTRPREGKSTTSFALAVVLARTGRRVLLIDADMRSPSLHHFFDLKHDKGLSNYLAGEDDWQKLVQATPNQGLSVMTAGPIPPNAAELLSSDRMSQLVETLRSEFDHVLIDAPPILGLADSPLLARATEGVVYVVEAGGAPMRGVAASIDRLRASQARLFGGVLTKMKRETGYGYGYGYGYGRDAEGSSASR